MDRNLALEFVRVSEAAALAAARLMGRGDEKAADHAAVEAMRKSFDTIDFVGTVKIGEGERDQAPMLYIGEKVGRSRPGSELNLDLAVDPLEGTSICAKGAPNALSVIAIGEKDKFLHAPDCYMEKIATGPAGRGQIDLDAPITHNLEKIAKAKGCKVSELTVVILDRPRHKDLIDKIRYSKARIWLISDGDVQGAIATASWKSGVDLLVGTGGAPEGVIAAAALKCMGGDFQGRLKFSDNEQKKRAQLMGITDCERIYQMEDLAKGPVMFCATGVTPGSFLKGVQFFGDAAKTHSVVMRSQTGTIRFITSYHSFKKHPLLGSLL